VPAGPADEVLAILGRLALAAGRGPAEGAADGNERGRQRREHDRVLPGEELDVTLVPAELDGRGHQDGVEAVQRRVIPQLVAAAARYREVHALEHLGEAPDDPGGLSIRRAVDDQDPFHGHTPPKITDRTIAV